MLAGIPMVSDRLAAVLCLSKKLKLTGDEELRSSGHILLEVQTVNWRYKKHNAPTAIRFSDLKAGIRAGKYPRWVAMTAPQFGFRGAERGGMLSKNPADRQMAKDLHVEAIERSMELQSAGLGAGINIWWPAWTSRRMDNPELPAMAEGDAWNGMLSFWVDVLAQTNGTMWLEWKPGDPGIDYLMTIEMAINFCNEVNSNLGREAMLINNEFAHILLSGITVTEGVQTTIKHGLFSKFVHANSGQMLPVSIKTLIDSGIRPESILIGTDWDWAVGVGGPGTWEDQTTAIGAMDAAGQQVIYCEHDVNPAGQDPLEVFALSIKNRQTMLMAARSL